MYANMKARLVVIIAGLLLLPMGIFGQTYEQLWKQVGQAEKHDLPQTAIGHLEQIEKRAQQEQAYGHLLKATLLHARLQAEIAPDSLSAAVERLEQEAATTGDATLEAVYATVLSCIYRDMSSRLEGGEAKAADYYRMATARPELLARVKAATYAPFVIKGKDSQYFGHDLLSVVGTELKAWDWLHRYYEHSGNRQAACLTALESAKAQKGSIATKQAQADYLARLDSLLQVYGDLPEAGEVAIERCQYLINQTEATPAQAVACVRQSLQRWGSWKRMDELRNAERELTGPQFNLQVAEHIAMSGEPQRVRLQDLRNLSSLTVQLYRTSLKGDTPLNPSNADDFQQIKPGMQLLAEHTRQCTFTGHPDYELFEDSILLPGLPASVYLIEVSTRPETTVERLLYYVSDVRLMAQGLPGNRSCYVAVDARSGRPLPGARIHLTRGYGGYGDKVLVCDREGRATDSREGYYRAFAETDADAYCPPLTGHGGYYFHDNDRHEEMVSLFTDRAIYRPGQTVHVSAIVFSRDHHTDMQAVGGKSLTLQLRDANYKLVEEQTVTTDDYGQCSTQFTLPANLLNGRFTIRTGHHACSIRVEEYKRPTFKVEIPQVTEAYLAGDTLHVSAKALSYAGVPVQGAAVRYTVKRRIAYWWMAYSWYWSGGYFGRGAQEEELLTAETTTADDGTFTADIPLTLPGDLGQQAMFYHFVVEADVTDQGGETHAATLSIPLGTKPTALTCNLPQQVRNDQIPQVTFFRKNAAGQAIEGTVRYRLDGGDWQTAAANAPLDLIAQGVPSGEHRLEAVCEADSVDMKFVVFALDDVRPATETRDWFYVSDTAFPADGRPVTVQVGSSDPDLYIAYTLFAGDQILESGILRENCSLWNRKLTYQTKYGNGVLLTFAWMKEGRLYRHSVQLRRPLPDKTLKMEWQTFRDRLTPGQQEEWRLRVTTPDGKPASAQLMAVLYDMSLDPLAPHQWTFAPQPYLPLPSTQWQARMGYTIGASGSQSYVPFQVDDLLFSHFDPDVMPRYFSPFFRSRGMMMRSAMPMAMAAAPAAGAKFSVSGNDAAENATEEALAMDAVAAEDVAGDDGEAPADDGTQVRENLQETAFFYPALTTDADGSIVLRFTLPESLTTWRFLSIAHTKDICTGSLQGETVAQKDIMVQPNVPRFVRTGDEAQLSARVFNTSERDVTATARLVLVDPSTEAVVYSQQQPVSIKAGQTAAVAFTWKPSGEQSLLVCKVTVSGDGFSDGEQHYLPVLPDCEMVTKTVPFTQHEPGVKSIDLTTLFPDGTRQQKLTIEYTNNPAWLMVQSLPVVGQPWEKSAIEQAAAFYANSLAQAILRQSPQVKTTFELWKRETGAEQTLQSQLEKDQELKDLVLSETPWVRAADREAEQKQQLADFFDANGIEGRLTGQLEKLKGLQNGDGSFSWYPGMEGSLMVTATVAEMLVRLNAMTGTVNQTRPLLGVAFNYMGREVVEMVDRMQEEARKGHQQVFPSLTALRWLYLCAIDGRSLPAKTQQANDYLIGLLKKEIRQQTIYEKALTAIVLQHHGETAKAAQYIQSLKEYTVYTEEMGRYFDTPRAGYSWFSYKIPTEVAAIEALKSVTPADVKTVDEMRRWLLQEKRTQAWDTPINSTNAIYAFLFDQAQILARQEETQLAIDGKPLDLPQATAGLGYVKTAISHPQGRELTATKTSQGTSWGAAYAQFMQPTAAIEASGSGITVRREITEMPPHLTIGSRIRVRITIETSRDLDFVQVSDRRAACMEPVQQLSGYRNGAYCSPKDNATNYYFYQLSKGKHVIETEYYIDRAGRYETGTCTVQCAYAPEFRATAPSQTLLIQ